MLSKNLKKFKRNLDKQGNRGESDEYDFLPSTYQLPSEYVIFYEEFKRQQLNDKILWIMKPVLIDQSRLPSARGRASSFSARSQISTAGKAPTKRSTPKTMSASATSSIPCSSEVGSSI